MDGFFNDGVCFFSDRLLSQAVIQVFFSKKTLLGRGPFGPSRSIACRSEKKFDPIWMNRPALEKIFKKTLKNRIFFSNQGHSDRILTIDANSPFSDNNMPICDALVTCIPGTVLAVYTADCVPILLCDPEVRVIAAVHGGWKGLKQNIIQRTIHAMEIQGAQSDRIVATIGPCISANSYKVSSDFSAHFPQYASCFYKKGQQDFCHLAGIAKAQLVESEIQIIDNIDIDTYENEQFFSYRRALENNESLQGVQVSAIALG